MTPNPRSTPFLILYGALALVLATLVLVASRPPAHAQTQTPTFKVEASYSGLPEVYEGAQVSFLVTQTSGTSASDVTVEIETLEPNLDDGNGNNPSLQTHLVTFPGNGGSLPRRFSVTAYVDGVDETTETSHILKARLVASSDGSYTLDAQNEAQFDILDPPATVPRISITSDSTGITEGDAASFTLTRTGAAVLPLTVKVNVEDPSGFVRGNYWDPPPSLPASVTFGANSSTTTISVQTQDDLRDTPNASFYLNVLPGDDYLLGHTGLETKAGTTVTDDDTAQELELHFGKEGVNDANVAEGDKLAFVVERRQQDAVNGHPANFTVRVETNRSGDDWRLDDWTEDTTTGRLYKDYPLQLAGSDLQVKEEFTVTFNGQSESNWDYRASIRPLQHYDGGEVTSGQEAEYWTVKPGFRETTIDATDSGASNGTISIDSDVLTVTEGQSVTYTLYRVDGPMNKPVTVQVRTREPNRGGGQGSNPSIQDHDVTIEAWRGHAEFTIYPYVDEVAEAGTDELIAAIRSIGQVDGADRYGEGQPSRVDVEINDPPSSSTFVTVDANPTSIVEGGSTTVTFTRSGGDTAQPLTVNIEVDDLDERLRGNHWNPAPAIPTEVIFPANSTTQTITLTFPDDQRDLDIAGLVYVRVLTGTGYYLGQSGNSGAFTTLSVTDNDTAQELTLKWGRISPDSENWKEGESYLTCDEGGTCTPGPAEGTFYYEDGRDFVVRHELEEPHPAHFLVSRRAADTGKTATFVVRVEHNRDWESPRHSDWPVDPETGNRYQEFPLTLTGNQRQVVGRIEVLDNGFADHALWQYSAEIKQIEDSASGTTLSPTDEAQYWTVNGDRNKTIWPNLVLGTLVRIKSVAPKQVPEGQAITITLERRFGNPLAPYPVQVRTWEPNQVMADGTNPTDQVHDVAFPAVAMSDLFVEYVTQTETLTLSTWDDSVYEARDIFKASLLVPSVLTGETLLLSTKTAVILDDDRPTITLSVDDTSITEGDTATFTLTRGNNTANELLVGVSVDDPGGFLEGNFASEAVAVPSSIMFAAGETTKEIEITPPDDWRDIPDNAITFTLAVESHYDIVGSTSLTVQVADNDVAPQVSISFNHAEIDEGNDLTLEIVRTGEDKNPLEIGVTAGLVGDEQYHVFGMDAGMSRLHFTYRQPDDSFRGPDHHYTATLHPGRAEFWVPSGVATVNGSILDNDPYVVSVEAITHRVDEGNLLYYRVSHNGHTGVPLLVKANHSETGSAVYDSTLGNQTHTIPTGSSSLTRAYLTHRNDGYDGDAEFMVDLLADDAYEIDVDSSSAAIIVRNKDPLPVLGFRDTSTTVSEGVGTVDIWVDLLAAVPPLKTVTIDYSAHDWYSGDGFNITQHTGTLTFAPGDTSAAVTVEVLQNSIAGSQDLFHVVLSNPVNAVLQDGVVELVHEGVIVDDESVVTLEAQAEAVDEGSDVILTLTRDGDPTDELTVWLQVAKTAPQAENRRDTVVFPAGDATVDHTISTTDDGQRNGSHTVTATLLHPPSIGEPRTYWVGRPSSDTVTVRETHLETVSLLTPTLRVAEGEPITLELARSGATPLTVTLEVTETGDYTTGVLPGTVSFGLREGSATVTIQTQNDTIAEDIGKLTVTLVDGTNYRAGWPNSHTFTIYDDDSVKPSVSVTKDQAWVNEGQPVSFTVTRSTPTDNALQARLELNRVRYRVTQTDLDDPTRGITTPLNHIHFDTEEISVDFPAGTQTVTITRTTTDDGLNHGNSTYHATVLNDSDDDYTALSNASAFIWVQDDDIPTVTGSSTTSEFYDGRYQVVLPFTRTGDVSGRLPLDYDLTYTGHQPAPLQDETETRTWIKGHGFEPGQATGVSIGDLGYVKALGRSGSLELTPYYCPDNPAACGYYPQYQVGTPSSITYHYYSNTMGVRIKADQASVAEGDPATFTLHRHGGKPDALTRPLEVTVNVTQEGEYISGSAPRTVSFAANQSTATLSVPTTDDAVDETDGAITVELEYTWSRGCDDEQCYRQREYQGSQWYVRSVTTAINDNDYLLPDVSVSDASADEADGTIEFIVSLSQANIERAASVDWSTSEDGSTTAATSDTDFTAASGTLNFAIGETEKTVTVTLLDDQLDEDDETFNLTLSNPSELTLADDTGTGTIVDDDIGYGIAFRWSTFHTEEGDDVLVSLQRLVPQESGGGVCYVTIQHECFSVATEGDTGNRAIAVNLDITQTGDFLSGALPSTVTFAQGVAAVELSLSTVDDSTVEADSSLSFNILDGPGYSPVYIGPPDSHNQGAPFRTLYLYDNDLAFSIDDVQADESAGQMDFTVSLNATAPQEVTVDVATVDGEATSHANVTASSLGQDFVARSDTLTFAAGEQTKTFSVVLLDDTIHEKAETFTVDLSTPSQNLNRYNSSRRWSTLTSLADDTAVGKIVDDEQELVASVSRSYSMVDEDTTGPVRFTVELSHPHTTASERNPAVGWRTVTGTAALGADYDGTGGKVTFMPGVNIGFIDVDIVDDNLFESSLETFSVELLAGDSRLVTISPTDATYEVSIRDNENLTASIVATAETVAEGNDTTFTVTLTGGVPADDINVPFETAGTATATDDYAAPKGAITFPPGGSTGKAGVLEISAGESKGSITFPIVADGISDDDETLKVEIFSVSTDQRAGSISATDNIATTTILDQDSLTVSIEGSPSVTEGATATFTITLSTVSDRDVSAGWATKQAGDTLNAGESAVPDKDYEAASGTVSIPAGDRSATFTVVTTEDTLAEGSETFVVTLEEATIGNSSPPEMVPLGVTEAEGTIIDDDTAPTGLTISSVSPSAVNEDSGATDITITVALDGTSQFTVDTPVFVEMIDRPGVQNNATLGVDYTATTVNTTIPAGDSSVTTTITLTPVDDSLSEDDEVARLSVKSTIFANSVGRGVRIRDNDVEPGEVTLTVSPDTVGESVSSLQLTVTGTLMGLASRVIDTVVSLGLADGTATAGEDYQDTTATLTIPAGEMSATAAITLTVLDDNIAEGNETLEVTGTVPGTITARSAEVVIEDNDQEPTSISLLVTSPPVNEGSGAVTMPVQATLLGGGTRSVDTAVAMSVLDVSATVTDDYTAAWDSSTLTIPAGEFSATANLTLTPIDDNIYEGNEQIAVRGANADPGLPVNGVRLTILDNDPQPTTVVLSLAMDTVLEGSGTHFPVITATLEGDSTLTSDVNLTVNLKGDTQRSQSYTAYLFSPLRIEAGQSSGMADLWVIGTDDDVEDEDETVTIEGASDHPDLAVVAAELTIANDDTSGVRVSHTSLTVREGERKFYSVALTSEPTSNVLLTVEVPANAGFTVNPGTLTFAPRSWGWKRIYVTGIEDPDADDEPAMQISHSLSSSDTKYAGASSDNVAITVKDITSASVVVAPTELSIGEGGSDDYTVVLDTQPTGDVTVTVSGFAGTALTLDKTTLTFTTSDWNVEQTITVTAGQDANAAKEVIPLANTVTGGGYDGITADSVVVTVTDDDTEGVTVSPTAITVVGGRSNEYSVVLDTEPAGDVVVTVAGTTGKELSLDKATLTFTDQDWDTAQVVTVTAPETASADTVTLSHTVSSTADSNYDASMAKSVAVTVLQVPGGPLVQVGVTASDQELTVPEGESKTYSIVLGSQPEGDVTVAIAGVTGTDLTISDSSLTFTTANWNTVQTVTATASHDDDAIDDTVTLAHTLTSTNDGNYDGLAVENVLVTIVDDETAGVTISETSLDLDEGDSDTYTVVLDSEPAGNVTVTIGGITGTDLTLDKTTLTFTPGNWNTVQTVSVAASQDDDAVDEEEVTITHTVTSADDTDYDGLAAADLLVAVADDDAAGVTISETSLDLVEVDSDTYSVVLDTEPAGNVTVAPGGVTGTDLTLDKTSLTFTAANWNTAQTVRVTAGQDDDAVDEEEVSITHTLTSSDDTDYDGLTAASIPVNVTDDDTAGVTISETSLDINEGDSDTYTVVLDTEPAGNVTVTLGGISGTDVSLDKTTLTFTSGNWDTAQTVSVTAEQDDDAIDEPVVSITHTVTSADDTDYDGLTVGSVAVTVADDDTAGVTISETSLDINEGGSDTYTVVLDTEPAGNVTVTLSGISGTDVSLDKTTLTFTSGNWDTAQTVTVTGEQDDDAVDEEEVTITHTVTSADDTDYDGVTAGSVAVTVTDDDTAGVTVSETSLEIDEGDYDNYTVVLDTEPAGDVTVTIGGIADTELSLDKTMLTFTTSNWDTAQTVKVTAEQDDDAVDEEEVTITHTVTSVDDTDYDGVTAGSVAVTVTDDEVPSPDFTLTMEPPTHGDTDGDGEVNLGDTLTYKAVADNTGNVPLENVRIRDVLVHTSGIDCGILRVDATCTVTAEYTIVQSDVEAGSITNTATATADGVADKTVTRQTSVDQVKSLTLDKTTTASGFDGAGESIPYSYKVTNAGTVSLSGILEIDDDKIASGDITCPSVPGGGLGPGGFLTCTGSYTTVQNDVDAGKVTNEATASLGNVTSGADSVTVNWRAPLGSEPQLTVSSGEIGENAGSFTFTLTLNPSSLQTVTVDYATSNGTATSSSDYTSASGTLTFSPGDTTKNVTVTIEDDDVDESDESFTITLTNAVNAAIPIASGSATIRDDDTAGVTVSDTSLDIDEGDSDTYTVVLDSQPTHTVTITVNDPSNTDLTAEPADLTFTSSNWDTAQTVTVTAAQDSGHDDEDGTVTHSVASSDSNYGGITVGDVLMNVTDDDDVPVKVSFGQASYTVAEGNSVAVKVLLDANPERTVEVPITVTLLDGAVASDYSGVPTSVVFNSGDTEKTFDFEAIQDTVDDDGEGVRLTFGTLPDRVNSTGPSQAVVSITDDDVPEVEVSFEQETYTIAEGSSVTVKVVLDIKPERTVEVPITVTNQGGTSSSDYSGVPPSVVFNSRETEKTFDFEATHDTDNDDGESVKLGFGSTLPTLVTKGSPDETVISITDDDVPSVTVTFAQATYTVAEGGSINVKVKLSADPERTVTIPITATGQGGASSSDYSGVPPSVVFNSGDTEKTFDFEATDDTVDDDDESVRLGFGSSLPTGVTKGSTGETVVSITDDDVPEVEVSFAQDSYTVAEGSSVTVKVKLSADPERTVSIALLKVNQDGASSSDYSGVPPSVVFNGGDTEKTFDFEASDDGVDDDGESVRLSFGTLPTRVASISPAHAVISIADDDVPEVTVSFEQSTYTVAEGSNVMVKVKLSADPERTVTIPLTKTNQGGASSSDYSNVPDSVVFDSGETEKTFDFRAGSDSANDDDESVRLGFGSSLPAAVTKGSPDETVVSITDDDVPAVTVSFEESSYTVGEGSSETIKVKLSSNPERTVTIPITATGQGGASTSDYSNVPADVVFNSGETEQTIDFEATQDTIDDDGESVRLGFGSSLPDGVTKGSPDETVVSITDDDVPAVTVSFEQASYTVTEGNSVAVKLVLSGDPERTVEVSISTTEIDGASSSDYSVVPQAVVFNSGDTEKTVSFSATDDSEDDDGERVRLNFGTLPPRVSSTGPSQAVVSITDDDVPSVTVSFEQGTYSVAEGNSITIKVKLSADPERTVTIPVTKTNQGGASSSDYSNVPSSVVFNSRETEKTFDFEATQDSIDDDGESVRLGFGSSLPIGVNEGSPDETVVSITDDDVPAVTVSFSQATYTVAEGSNITVKVKLSADPERTVTIPLTKTNQGGASPSDYSNVPADVVFNDGDTEKTFDLEATQDTIDDDGESVRLGFGSSLPAGVTKGSPDEAVVSIADDDVPPVTVSFSQAAYTVAEGSSVTVKVKLSADPERTVTIPLTKTNQGGASSSDYSNVPASVVINPGETEKTFGFIAASDSANDDGESVRLGFGLSLPNGVTKGSPDETVVSITDDDVPSVTVTFAQATYTVAEGGSVTVKVKLSADPERTVTIPLTKTNQGGASSSDYSGVPPSVVFNGGDTEKTFDFEATDDTVDDDDESAKLGFGSSLPTGVTKGSPSETVVSITDDDVPEVEVSFAQSSYTVAEGSSVTVKVKLSADPERTVTIPLTKTNQGGASSSDYSNVPASVVFNTGETEKTFDFSAASDSANDDNESVRLGFGSSLPTGVTAGTPDETVVSIADDDVPSVTVSFEEGSYSVIEGDNVTITVTLSVDPERTVTIPLTKTDQDGASPSDYSMPQNVVFDSGETERTFDFEATDDEEDDNDESVKIGLGTLPTGMSEGTTNETVVEIVDNDGSGQNENKILPGDDGPEVTVSFELSSYVVAEGNSVTVKVVLDVDPERTIEVPITVTNEGGASTSDYSNVPTSVVFNSGDTEKTFDFEATQDTVDDDGESVRLGFGSSLPTGVSEGTTYESVVSITDDDVPSVTVSFGQASYTVAEGNSVRIKVLLNTNPERTVEVPLTVTTLDGADAADFSGVPASVIFNSGDTEKTFDFEATQDTVDDDGEGVRLTFGTLPGRVNSMAPSQAVVSIRDDDVPSVNVSFEQATYTVAEGSSVTVKVKLSANPERTVTIPLTKTNQNGASSADYSNVPASVTFNSGETEKTIDFSAASDSVDDDGESVRLGFGSSLPNGVTKGSPDETVVSITDDDVPPVTVSFAQASYSVVEGSNVTIKVKLNADPERTLTIPLTRTTQGGASSSDYFSVPQNVVFNSGDTEKTFDFSAASDDEDDDGESVRLGFGSSLPNGVTKGSPDETVVSIMDDDDPSVTVGFDRSSYSVVEGYSVTVEVTLSADPERTVTIPLTKTNQGGASSTDYANVPENVVFSSGDTEKSFTFTAVQDDQDEDDEIVTLGFDTLPDGVSGGDTVQSEVTILDSIRVSFGASSYEAYEGGAGAQVTVDLDTPAPFEIAVPITASGMNGATSNDWTGVPPDLTFATGDIQKSFTLMAYDDQIEDDGESVEIGFGNLPAGVVEGTPSVATVNLMNTEAPTCETAVWCATVEFAYTGSKDWERMGLGLGYHAEQEPYLRYSSLSDNRFTFRGKEYQVWSMFTTPGVHPDIPPGSPGRIPQYSTFSIRLMEVVEGELKLKVDQEHQRDWTLYIDGIALPFTDVVSMTSSGNAFIWHHPKLQDLYADWTDGDTYEIMIAEDRVDERPEPPMTVPMAPRYLRVMPGDGSVTAVWKQPLQDGNSDLIHYRLQWKPGTESWSNPNVIVEVTVQPPGERFSEVFHTISGLTNYTHYSLRVIAVNGEGDSEPSVEHFGMPQEESLHITDTVVNGNQLTITYERTLDVSSIPDQEAYRVLVNGAPRNVTDVSISGKAVILTLEEPAKRVIRATDEVEFRYVMPPSGAQAIRDTAGNYAYSCEFGEPPSEARNETDPGLLEPVSAEFKLVPASHSGPGSEVVFRIEFSEPVRVDFGPNHAYLLEVEGGKVTTAWWLDRDTAIWEIVLEPTSDDDVRITLPAGRACDARGAPCASGKRGLESKIEITILGSN